jgi:streptogramin lyase
VASSRGQLRQTGFWLVAAAVAVALAVAVAASASDPPSGAPVGSVTIHPLGARETTGLALGNDADLWITQQRFQGETQTPVVVISPTGAPRASFEIAPPSALMTVGPDGNFWLGAEPTARDGADAYAVKLTPAHAVTTYPIKPVEPRGAVSAPDGNLYFYDGATVYRLTTDGTVTPLATVSEADTGGLAVGADGNLWLREWHPNIAVARITLDGTVTEFPMKGVFETDPQGIAAGPDGNIWTTERHRNRIARVAPDGTITEFMLPRDGADPNRIVAGSDGNLWFTEAPDFSIAPMVGRITPGGDVTEYPLPPHVGGGIIPMIPGADGNVWFSDGDAVGRITVADPAVRYAISRDAGFVPATSALELGRTVQWTFYGPSVHEVADATGLGLFDSGPKSIVSSFRVSPDAAGVYAYDDPLHPGQTGTITVQPTATPAGGGTATGFAITWATEPPAPGRVFDIQILRPGAAGYAKWMTGTTATGAGFTPDAGPGRYTFRARLRDTGTGAKTRYAAKTITVS